MSTHETNDNDTFPQIGIVVADPGLNIDAMGSLAHAVVDDIIYNIIHDIVLQTHREEKIARAASAAISAEQKAAETDPNNHEDLSTEHPILPHHVETEAAIYNSGEVYLKGNPLKNVSEIRCSKCGLPRLLYPTDGQGARKPEPGMEYCKRRPFINKPHYDVYGQTFVPEGPGRGKKKKDMIDPLKLQLEGSGSQDSPGASPPPGEGPAKPIPFPHAKCINCNTFLPIKRMNNHMNKCIGGNGRESSRNALNKIQNGNGNGSQNGFTPPGSRNSTPTPSNKNRSSPSKRSADDAFGSDDSPEKKPKKPLKKTPANKLKAPKMAKSASSHSASGLSFEQKPPLSDEEVDDGGDDDRDGDFNGKDTIAVETKKKNKLKPPKPVISKKPVKPKSKWLYGKGGIGNNIPPALPPDTKVKPKADVSGKGGLKRGESESSQTLSSPNAD